MIFQITGWVPDQTGTTNGRVILRTLHKGNKTFETRFWAASEELRKRHEKPPRFFLGPVLGARGGVPKALGMLGRGTSYQFFNNVPGVGAGLLGRPSVARPIPAGQRRSPLVFMIFSPDPAEC